MGNSTQNSGKPKRGVSLYSYSGEYGVTMTMEDMFADIHDMGARGLEILANGHIDGYPEPTDEWVENWFHLLKKYDLVPVEYGHWVDSRLYQGRELSTQESYDMLIRDIKLANRLGFTVLRTKLGVIDDDLTPVKNWREFIAMALPDAEKYNVRMCPEIHNPTVLRSKMVEDYVEFIEKEKTKHFGINVDFGVFQTDPIKMWEGQDLSVLKFSAVEDIIPLLPYVYACHAKFVNMSDDFVETTTPYDRVLKVLIDHKWDGYLLSEYEGKDKDVPGYVSGQLRRQHIMMKRLLGD
ncbi:MAG TPA: TIM barrel protein [Anaerolineaceae bacterium]|nr:TIM barrel protein [Anaerolineaceae bacterium]